MSLSARTIAVALLALVARAATASAAEPATPLNTAPAVAVRSPVPVVIDGRDDDGVWRVAPAITDFTQFAPLEGGPARFKT
ncbi:MAG: hypothetical protein E6K80_14045, partial [Candidatus Eisenbacteria bacterium]